MPFPYIDICKHRAPLVAPKQVILKISASHQLFAILSHSNLHLALSHLVSQSCAASFLNLCWICGVRAAWFLNSGMLGKGGSITFVMHYGWVCSCEQGLIGAEAASYLIKRVHGLVGAGQAGGGGSAAALPLCLQYPLSLSLCPW